MKTEIIMLPTDKESRILKRTSNKFINFEDSLINDFNNQKEGTIVFKPKLCLTKKYWQPQHLYQLSDEGIQDGDWIIIPNSRNIPHYVDGEISLASMFLETWKKIIASTDKSLGLPIISDEFIQEYIDNYNNPSKQKWDDIIDEYANNNDEIEINHLADWLKENYEAPKKK